MADGRVVYQIVGDTSQLSADMKSADGIIRQSASSWDSIAKSAAAAVGTAFTAATAAGVAGLTALGKEGLAYNTQLEQSKRSFATFLGDEKEAEKVMQRIVDYAAVTPFDVGNLTDSVKMLVSADIAADDAIDTVLALGDAVAATGGGTDALSRMAANLQQVSNVGKASAMDVKQFAMAGINIYKVLSDYTGQTAEDLQGQEISYQMISEALKNAAAEGGRYYGAMESQSETLDGKISTLKDTFTQFTGRITEDLTPAAKVVVSALTDMLNNSGELEPVLKGIFTSISDGIITVVEKAGNLGDLISPIVGMVGDLAGHVGDLLPKIKELGGESIGKIAEKAAELQEKLKPLADGILDNIKSAIEAITPSVSDIKSFIESISSALGQIMPYITELGGELLEKIAENAGSLKSKIEPLVTNVLETLKSTMADLVPRLKDLADTILSNISKYIENMKSPLEIIVDRVIPVIMELLPGIIELLMTIGEQVLAPIIKYIAELAPKLQELADKLMPAISDFLGKIIGFLKDLVTGLIAPLIKFISDITEPLMHFIGEILPPLIEFIGKVVEIVGNLARTILPPLFEIIKNIVQKLEPLATTILRDIIDFGKKIAEKVGELVKRLAPLMETVGEVASALLDLLTSTLEPIYTWLQQNILPFIDIIIDKLGEIAGWLIDQIQNALNLVKGAIDGVKEAFNILQMFLTGNFQGAWEAVCNFMDSATKGAAEAITGWINGAIQTVSNAVATIKSLVSGIGSGIEAVSSGEIKWYELPGYVADQLLNKDKDSNKKTETAEKATSAGTAEKAAGAGTSSSIAGSANTTTVNVTVNTELDGDKIATSTFNRIDDYAGAKVRG